MKYFELKEEFCKKFGMKWTCTQKASTETDGLVVAYFLDSKGLTTEVRFNPDTLEVAYFKCY